MLYGLWQSVAGMQAQEYRQALIANNLANVDTAGFKPDVVSFQERLRAAESGGNQRWRHPTVGALTGGFFETEVKTDHTQGAAVQSGNPFDVMLKGDGFLAVQTAQGEQYTRDGRMFMASDGVLRHGATGGAVLDAGGSPITLDPTAGVVRIDEVGGIRQGGEEVARLSVVAFEDPQQLKKVGQNMYDGAAARHEPAGAEVRQNWYEGSAVDPTTTMVEMISAARAYEINARMISLQDQVMGQAVNEVGRIG